jgi:hypothetical protein
MRGAGRLLGLPSSKWGDWASQAPVTIDVFKDATVDAAVTNAIGTLVKLDKELVRLGEFRGTDVNVTVNLGVMQITLTRNYSTKT